MPTDIQLPTLADLYQSFLDQQSKQEEHTSNDVASSCESQTSGSNSKKQKEQRNNTQERFKRVREEEVEFVDERLKDNSFLAKSGADNSYGFKAHQDLIVTRGKGFTKEKNKKKKGSYRGGHIDTQSHSIKFSYSDDE